MSEVNEENNLEESETIISKQQQTEQSQSQSIIKKIRKAKKTPEEIQQNQFKKDLKTKVNQLLKTLQLIKKNELEAKVLYEQQSHELLELLK